MQTKSSIHTFPTNEQIQMATKRYGEKKIRDHLNELDRIRDTIRLIIRRGNEEGFLMVDELDQQYRKILEKFLL